VKHDFCEVFDRPQSTEHGGSYTVQAMHQSARDSLLQSAYGRRWLVVAFDEAHVCIATTRPLYHAHRALASSSHFVAAVTATPVVTSATNLIDMARMACVPGFQNHDSDQRFFDYRREEVKLRKALRAESGDEGKEPILYIEALRSFADAGNPATPGHGAGQTLIALLTTQTAQLRHDLSDYHIRRENKLSSDTPEEDRDSYPPPPIHVDVCVKMYAKEFAAINQAYLDAGAGGRKDLMKGPQSVSICGGRTLWNLLTTPFRTSTHLFVSSPRIISIGRRRPFRRI
jgi:hypothetical protein